MPTESMRSTTAEQNELPVVHMGNIFNFTYITILLILSSISASENKSDLLPYASVGTFELSLPSSPQTYEHPNGIIRFFSRKLSNLW